MTESPLSFTTQAIEIPWAAWHRDATETLMVPASFQVERLAPHGGSALDAAGIRDALARPIGTSPLDDLARSCRTACIAVDDLTRPTRTYEILPYLLESLQQTGLSREQISIVIATGSHASPTTAEIAMKIGDQVARNYRVLPHNCREDLTGTGIQYGDRELLINSTFLKSDLRITLGAVLPHSFAGFSGGAKMVLPGLSDLDAIRRSHKRVQLVRRRTNDINDNIFRTEAEALVRQIGVDFSVNVVVNSRRETVALFAGDIVEAHRSASRLGSLAYSTPLTRTYDIALLNSYPKDGDLVQAATSFIPLKGLNEPPVKPDGIYILASATWHGVGEHGVYGADSSLKEPGPLRILGGRELWLYTPQLTPSETGQLFWNQYRVFERPEQLAEALRSRFPGGTHMAVLPCAPMQQFRDLRDA